MGKSERVEEQESLHNADGPTNCLCSATVISVQNSTTPIHFKNVNSESEQNVLNQSRLLYSVKGCVLERG